MSTKTVKLTAAHQDSALQRLIRSVVDENDRNALAQFHERRLFRADGRRMRFIEFVQWLGSRRDFSSIWKHNTAILEWALDLLTDKFTMLPADPASKPEGVDARLYFEAYLRNSVADERMKLAKDDLTRELRSAEILQDFIRRHFVLSVLEARRRMCVGIRRYLWALERHRVYLWLPREMSARECRDWLNERAESFPVGSQNLRELIQERINNELWLPRILNDSDGRYAAQLVNPPDPAMASLEHEISVRGLSEVVAQEKADRIHLQPPSIQAIGPDRLRQMVLRIFEDLTAGTYVESDVAREFGLNKVSFHRFARRRWRHAPNGSMTVPGLWRNVAWTLSNHPTFVAGAKDFGVWPGVEQVLSQRSTMGESDHE